MSDTETPEAYTEAAGLVRRSGSIIKPGLNRALQNVADERWRIDREYGPVPSFPEAARLAVLVEEVGEVAAELQYPDVPEDLRKELVQVAAVAVRWIEHLDHEEATNA